MRLSYTSKNNGLKKDEIEKRILERFPDLNDNQQYHNLFCSYDFHENEKNMLEFWKDVIEFLFESVKNTHGLKHEDILELIKIKGKKPLGLNNITQKLIEEGDLIPSSLLTTDCYFKKFFPEFVQIKETWGGWMKRNISSMFFKDKKYIPKTNEVLLNRKMFLEYNEEIMRIFDQLLHEEDLETITQVELKQVLRKNDLDDSLLDYSLAFLEKMKRLSKFIVKIEGKEVVCIKYLKDENSSVSLKDNAIVNLTLSIKKLDKTVSELHNRIEETKVKAKEFLLKKEKQQASNLLKKKIILQRSYDHFFNMKLSLEQNLLDIKSMESNQNIHNVLLESSKATHTLKINVDEFENVADKVKDNVDNLREINDIIGDFNSEVLNNEELEKELNDLQIAGEKNKQFEEVNRDEEDRMRLSQNEKLGISKLFPKAKDNNIIMNEIEDKNKEKEGFIEENSFQMILEELNKK